ncbi:MAG: cysteine desulfurase [Firmicutes bacterium]|nr:cysteine desulfurase [Bacillota bacterium]
MIYFDNASTTKPFNSVIEEMNSFNSEYFFNPSALYKEGLAVNRIIDGAREVVANKLGVASEELYFTSSATEANNWALLNGIKNKKGNVVISQGEHASIFECGNLLRSRGIEVRWVTLKKDGTIDLNDLENKVDEYTALSSIIHVSNETGAINDIKLASNIIKNKNPNTLFHADGAAAFCKISNFNNIMRDINRVNWLDFYTISAHKVCGPKGIGALYINKNRTIAPLIVGGGQERGQRSGTENTAAIIGFAQAVKDFSLTSSNMIKEIHDYLKNSLMKCGWMHNGSEINTGYILSLSNPKIKAEILMRLLSEEGVLIGLGSACANKLSQNRVLSALGATKTQIEGSIRLSFCPTNTIDEAKIALSKIIKLQKILEGKLIK